jgi:hypothetical protein
MPATPERAAFVREEFRRAVALAPTASARYGNLARKSDDPVETFFDSVAHAQTVASARQSLLSAERRRFNVQVVGLDELDGLDFIGAVPIATYVDTARKINKAMIVSEIVMDYERGKASLLIWG